MFKNTPLKRHILNTPDIQNSRDYVEQARATARKLIRKHGYCTSDMVKRALPVPNYLHPAIIGHVFLGNHFKRIGLVRGHENKGGGRIIWKWVENDS
jgi:hypothetical protein